MDATCLVQCAHPGWWYKGSEGLAWGTTRLDGPTMGTHVSLLAHPCCVDDPGLTSAVVEGRGAGKPTAARQSATATVPRHAVKMPARESCPGTIVSTLALLLLLQTCGRGASGVGAAPALGTAPSQFDWIRAIAASTGGGRFFLNATTYLIDAQYQLPPGTNIHGSGSGQGGTVICAVGLQPEGPLDSLVLGDNTVVSGFHFVGVDTRRVCFAAAVETVGCSNSSIRFTTPPTEANCGTREGRMVTASATRRWRTSRWRTSRRRPSS